jgi:hypothetical protein
MATNASVLAEARAESKCRVAEMSVDELFVTGLFLSFFMQPAQVR